MKSCAIHIRRLAQEGEGERSRRGMTQEALRTAILLFLRAKRMRPLLRRRLGCGKLALIVVGNGCRLQPLWGRAFIFTSSVPPSTRDTPHNAFVLRILARSRFGVGLDSNMRCLHG